MWPKLLSLLVGAGFFLSSGPTVAVVAILVFAPIALFMSGDAGEAEEYGVHDPSAHAPRAGPLRPTMGRHLRSAGAPRQRGAPART